MLHAPVNNADAKPNLTDIERRTIAAIATLIVSTWVLAGAPTRGHTKVAPSTLPKVEASKKSLAHLVRNNATVRQVAVRRYDRKLKY